MEAGSLQPAVYPTTPRITAVSSRVIQFIANRVPRKLLTEVKMSEHQRTSDIIFTRPPKQLFQEVKEALLGTDSSASLRMEAMNKATKAPRITDITFKRPTGLGSEQAGSHQTTCFFAVNYAKPGPLPWSALLA